MQDGITLRDIICQGLRPIVRDCMSYHMRDSVSIHVLGPLHSPSGRAAPEHDSKRLSSGVRVRN